MFNKIKRGMDGVKGKVIAVLGLSFKPNTDDLRDAPSIYLMERLLKEKAKLRTYDPVAMDNARALFPGVVFCRDAYEAAKGADALVIVTEWNQFRNLDLEKVKGLLRQPLFFDLRNIYEPEKVKKLGFKYFCVGRS
jgi:UDPglucose 6-dehydrogenase